MVTTGRRHEPAPSARPWDLFAVELCHDDGGSASVIGIQGSPMWVAGHDGVLTGHHRRPGVRETRLPACRFLSKVLPLPSPALSGIPYANFL